MTDLGYFINILKSLERAGGVRIDQLMSAYPEEWQRKMGALMKTIDRTRIENAVSKLGKRYEGQIPTMQAWGEFLDNELSTFYFSDLWDGFQRSTQGVTETVTEVGELALPALKWVIPAAAVVVLLALAASVRRRTV